MRLTIEFTPRLTIGLTIGLTIRLINGFTKGHAIGLTEDSQEGAGSCRKTKQWFVAPLLIAATGRQPHGQSWQGLAHRQTDGQTDTHTHKDTHTQKHTDTRKHKTGTHTHRHTHTHTYTITHRHKTGTHTHRTMNLFDADTATMESFTFSHGHPCKRSPSQPQSPS